MRHEIKKAWSVSTMTASCHCNFCFMTHAYFSKQLAANTWRAPPFISFVHMHATISISSWHRAMPINLLLLQEFYPCGMQGIFTCSRLIACTNPLSPTHSCVCKLTSSHTYQSIKISICFNILWVCIARYLQCVVNTISKRVPQLNNPGHPWVSSHDLVSML